MPSYSNPQLDLSSNDVVPVVLDTPFASVCVGLRIANPLATWATVSVVTLAGATRSLDVPPSTVITEALRCSVVNTAGTTPGLTIMAYQNIV